VRIPSWDEIKSFFLILALKILPFVSGVLIVGFELYRHFMGKATDTAQMTVILGVGLFLIVLAQFEKLQELSVLGLTVKLKETIKEAEATIEQVRELALLLGQPLTKCVLRMGTWGGSFNSQELIQYKNELETYYQRMGITKDKIEKTIGPFQEIVNYRYSNELFKNFKENLYQVHLGDIPATSDKDQLCKLVLSAIDTKSKAEYQKALLLFEELTFPDEATKAEVLKNIQIIGAYINDEELPSYPS
jgi:hypothetical protein